MLSSFSVRSLPYGMFLALLPHTQHLSQSALMSACCPYILRVGTGDCDTESSIRSSYQLLRMGWSATRKTHHSLQGFAEHGKAATAEAGSIEASGE